MQKNTLFLIVLILCLGCNCEELTVGTDGTNSTEDPDGTEGKPDLRVSSIDTPVVDCSLGECESFAVVTIQNDGEATANSFTVKTIFDPEIPVDIYELGLIYDVFVNEDLEVKILMTLTTPNCPVAETLPLEVEEKVKSLNEVKDAEVEITFDPPWSQELMSEEAKLELGML